MSKCGSPYLRRAIWMAGAVAVQYDPMFRAYYEKKAAADTAQVPPNAKRNPANRTSALTLRRGQEW